MLFITLGLAGRSMADFTCDAKYFLKHASTGAYYTINNANGGGLQASGNHRGWFQQFTVCRDSSWSSQFFVLKSEAMSSQTGQDRYVRQDSEYFYAIPGTLTGNHLFEWRGGGSDGYYALVHAESGRYLTVNLADGHDWVYLGGKNFGWEQALYRED